MNEPLPGKTHELKCPECQTLTQEWIQQNDAYNREQTRLMIKDEFQTRQDIITEQEIQKKSIRDLKWLVAGAYFLIIVILVKMA
jgi:hypothetical protein